MGCVVGPVNLPPGTGEEQYGFFVTGSGYVFSANLPLSLFDPENDPLTVTGFRTQTGANVGPGTSLSGQFGVLQVNTDGSLTYTPNLATLLAAPFEQTPLDKFAYSITDGFHAPVERTLILGPSFTGITWTGGSANDSKNGTAGEDRLDGAGGNDTVRGGAGNDTIFGQSGDDNLYGGAANDTLNGGSGNDKLWGDADSDTLVGDAGNDELHGGEGFDNLSGGTGNDTLYGGSEDDNFTGGSGIDIVVIEDNADSDTFLDFQNGVDKISFAQNNLVDSFLDLNITTQGSDVIVGFGIGHLTIIGAAGQIEASDFIF